MPGIKQVAELAGVSVGTVSNVLNRPWVVARDTRARVQQAVEQTGFTPNSAARRLRAGDRQSVGVVIDDLRGPDRGDLLAGVADGLESTGRHVLLHNAGGSLARFAAQVADLGSEGVRSVLVCLSPPMTADIATAQAVRRALRVLHRRQITAVVVDVSTPRSDHHLGPLNDSAFTLTSTIADALEACVATLADTGRTEVVLAATGRIATPLAREIRPLARAAGVRVRTSSPKRAFQDPDAAVVICDRAAGLAYSDSKVADSRVTDSKVTDSKVTDSKVTGSKLPAGVPIQSRSTGAGAIALGPALVPVGAPVAYAQVAAYQMGRIAVDIMLTDPDPTPAEGAGLRLPALVTDPTADRVQLAGAPTGQSPDRRTKRHG